MDRPSLKFESLEQGLDYAFQLMRDGHECQGRWNLSQCLGHLDQWLTFPMDGFPSAGIIGPVLWLMKVTSGKKQLQSILADGFRPGIPTMPKTVPAADAQTVSDSYQALKQTVARFASFDQPIHASPVFGDVDKAAVRQLQLRHFEHHLSFFKPKSA